MHRLEVFAIAVFSVLIGCQANTETEPKIAEWEYGYETTNVRATRMIGPLGVSIKFEFPNHPNQCDHPSLEKSIRDCGGVVIQMGGYHGAPIHALFRGVNDRESANKKIIESLPNIENAVKSLK